jgi:hypothetical protein
MNETSKLAAALHATLISPNEHDSNSEAANVVDGLFAIARAIEYLGDQIKATAHHDRHEQRHTQGPYRPPE